MSSKRGERSTTSSKRQQPDSVVSDLTSRSASRLERDGSNSTVIEDSRMDYKRLLESHTRRTEVLDQYRRLIEIRREQQQRQQELEQQQRQQLPFSPHKCSAAVCDSGSNTEPTAVYVSPGASSCPPSQTLSVAASSVPTGGSESARVPTGNCTWTRPRGALTYATESSSARQRPPVSSGPNTPRQGPNSPRQGPNSPRQGPNSPRQGPNTSPLQSLETPPGAAASSACPSRRVERRASFSSPPAAAMSSALRSKVSDSTAASSKRTANTTPVLSPLSHVAPCSHFSHSPAASPTNASQRAARHAKAVGASLNTTLRSIPTSEAIGERGGGDTPQRPAEIVTEEDKREVAMRHKPNRCPLAAAREVAEASLLTSDSTPKLDRYEGKQSRGRSAHAARTTAPVSASRCAVLEAPRPNTSPCYENRSESIPTPTLSTHSTDAVQQKEGRKQLPQKRTEDDEEEEVEKKKKGIKVVQEYGYPEKRQQSEEPYPYEEQQRSYSYKIPTPASTPIPTPVPTPIPPPCDTPRTAQDKATRIACVAAVLQGILVQARRVMPCYYCGEPQSHTAYRLHLDFCRPRTEALLARFNYNPLRLVNCEPSLAIPSLMDSDATKKAFADSCYQGVKLAIVPCPDCGVMLRVHDLPEHYSMCVIRSHTMSSKSKSKSTHSFKAMRM